MEVFPKILKQLVIFHIYRCIFNGISPFFYIAKNLQHELNLTHSTHNFLFQGALRPGLPIGQYFLYKLIGKQKDVGYKKLLTKELVFKARYLHFLQ